MRRKGAFYSAVALSLVVSLATPNLVLADGPAEMVAEETMNETELVEEEQAEVIIENDEVEAEVIEVESVEADTVETEEEESYIDLEAPVVKAEAKDGKIVLNWKDVPDATEYYVYRTEYFPELDSYFEEDTDEVSGEESYDENDERMVDVFLVEGTTFEDDEVLEGVQYAYWVAAGNEEGESYYNSNLVKAAVLVAPSVTCSPAEQSIRVKWNAVNGATSYVFYRRAKGNGWTKVMETSATSVDDSNLTEGTTYFFTVRAVFGDTRSAFVESKSIQYLPAPTVKTAVSGSGIKLSWNAVKGTTGYYVYRKNPGETSWTRIGETTDPATVTYTDKKVVAGQTYLYTVRSHNGSTLGGYNYDGFVGQYLEKPLLNVSLKEDDFSLTWSEVAGAKKYRIYRKTGSESWKMLKEQDASEERSYTDTFDDEVYGKPYYYTVKALSDVTAGEYYKDVTVTRLVAPVVSASGGPTVKWDAVEGATSYRVYSKTEDGEWTEAGTSTGTSLAVKGAVDGTLYYYTARAEASNSYGPQAEEPTSYLALTTPELVSATADASGITVKWKAVNAADSYIVYRKDAAGGSWKRVTVVSDVTSYKDTGLTAKKSYVYTVRAQKDEFLSGYDSRGFYCVYSTDPAYKMAADIINSTTKSSQSNIDKLKTAYMWFSKCSYQRDVEVPTKLSSTAWISKYAQHIFSTKKGNCYKYAAGFAYTAAVLGYQPKVVCGKLKKYNSNHGWVEIPIDGTTYTFDPEYQFELAKQKKNYNLFKRTYSTNPFALAPQKRYSL